MKSNLGNKWEVNGDNEDSDNPDSTHSTECKATAFR